VILAVVAIVTRLVIFFNNSAKPEG
jgi:hypothetical protein